MLIIIPNKTPSKFAIRRNPVKLISAKQKQLKNDRQITLDAGKIIGKIAESPKRFEAFIKTPQASPTYLYNARTTLKSAYRFLKACKSKGENSKYIDGDIQKLRTAISLVNAEIKRRNAGKN
ncbi:MAG: hypothetical protein WCW13_05005 [archaeon]|jgi:hypothetical protein